MLSGNGRHRRPRQAPAIIVAAGVTGSAIAIPLLGAGSASAADSATWDRVAECESGGQWSASMGNGYYGGLQISQQTWEDFGGAEYAERADLASRSQQISVAEKVLDAQGPDAWATCAGIAGLTADGTGATQSPAPTDNPLASLAPSASATQPAEPASPAPTQGIGNDGGGSASSEPSAEPSGSATESKTPAPSESTEPADADKAPEEGDRASRGDTSARDGADAADETGKPGKSGNTDSADVPSGTYTVRVGDNLWSIADEQKVPGGWNALYEANAAAVGDDPDLILPGQSLDLDLK